MYCPYGIRVMHSRSLELLENIGKRYQCLCGTFNIRKKICDTSVENVKRYGGMAVSLKRSGSICLAPPRDFYLS